MDLDEAGHRALGVEARVGVPRCTDQYRSLRGLDWSCSRRFEIFAGTIRFSEEFNVTHGISGPTRRFCARVLARPCPFTWKG